jgi:hypothetical protein
VDAKSKGLARQLLHGTAHCPKDFEVEWHEGVPQFVSHDVKANNPLQVLEQQATGIVSQSTQDLLPNTQ